jgi:hypothetical protein
MVVDAEKVLSDVESTADVGLVHDVRIIQRLPGRGVGRIHVQGHDDGGSGRWRGGHPRAQARKEAHGVRVCGRRRRPLDDREKASRSRVSGAKAAGGVVESWVVIMWRL